MPQPSRRRCARHWLGPALLAAGVLAAMPGARAQPAAPTSPSPSPSPPPPAQQVEITATLPDNQQERRQSSAAKIVVGRDEIERMGDGTVGEILKRLPGVVVSGRPGRGGDVRLRGLGNGYTQILIDGERMPRGFSLDSIEPDQIERIEILRAPTAETGARAIAGTINVVLREDVRRHQQSLRLALGSEQGQPQANLSWTRSDQAGPLDYTLTATANHRDQRDQTRLHTQGWDADGHPVLDQLLQGQSRSQQDSAFVSARLRWRDGRDSWELQPYLTHSESRSDGSNTLLQRLGSAPAPYARSSGSGTATTTLARAAGSWLHLTDDGARLQLRLGSFNQLAAFGDDVQARTLRLAGYVQDDWSPSRQFGLNAGLRWEQIGTRSDSALAAVRNTSSVWAPLLHAVWRLPDAPRDQIRLSLTRSYRTPTTAQLIARPSLSTLYPASGPNQPTSPDRAGNPELRPELATGLDLAIEHYLEGSGIVSANVFVRRIHNLIRNVRGLQTVDWSPVPRWVSQPQNIG
ncbi:MAG: hypothetical protein CFE45_41995, partial [Burkholderiales bacterium PBB5]